MYYDIPEFHDEQHFQISNTAFGPLVYFYASPFLGMFERVSDIAEQGEFGTFAASVEVDAPPGTVLDTLYTRLNLQPGVNCLWLANAADAAGNPTGWKAYVTPQSPLTGDCTRPAPGTVPALRVTRFTDGTKFRHADYPPVARFSESTPTGPRTYGQPFLGVKCLDGWCEIGPVAETPAPVTTPSGFERYGAIKGWHDEQMLAYEVAGVLRPAVRATLIPDRLLATYKLESFPIVNSIPANSEQGWVPVATIILAGSPPTNSKYQRWGLVAGENFLFLRRKTPGTGPNDWQMSIVNAINPTRVIWTNVTQERHTDVLVPATARWRFASFDPTGVWVRCGEACCSGDGGT